MAQSVTVTENTERSRSLATAARNLRSAVLVADHARAGQLLQTYLEELSALWKSMSEAQRIVSDLPDQSSEFLAWARQATLIHRALSVDQLAILQKASRYQSPGLSSALRVSA